VTGTPAYFVNGVFLSGAQPYERFEEIIEEELAKLMWFNRNGHHAKNNYQESEVFDESEAKATELHERV